MNDLQKEQSKCPHFELDDWGVCIYQYDWENDSCKNNCSMNYDKLVE